MKIAIGSDHRGFLQKQFLIESLQFATWVDVGCFSQERCDFPFFAQDVAFKVQNKEVDAGILLCGTGIGMSIAANRFKGVYAALVWNVEVARLSKEHNNANVLVLPSDMLSQDQIKQMVFAWQQAVFLGGRYQERIGMIDSK